MTPYSSARNEGVSYRPRMDQTRVETRQGTARPRFAYHSYMRLGGNMNHAHNLRFSVEVFVLLACLLVGHAAAIHAQEPRSADSLLQTVAGLDKALFDAYNDCDLGTLGRMVSDDLEFYHDHDGLSVGRQVFLESNQKNICGKVRRELVAGTLEVYPLGSSGALEIGVHRFHHPGLENTEPGGEAKFVIIWQQRDGAWKMTRTISYGHGTASR